MALKARDAGHTKTRTVLSRQEACPATITWKMGPIHFTPRGVTASTNAEIVEQRVAAWLDATFGQPPQGWVVVIEASAVSQPDQNLLEELIQETYQPQEAGQDRERTSDATGLRVRVKWIEDPKDPLAQSSNLGIVRVIPRTPPVKPPPLSERIGKLMAVADAVAPKPKPARQHTPQDIEHLRELLATVRDQDITNKAEFVDVVNRLLKATNHRIVLPDGKLALLVLNRLKGHEYIRFVATNAPNHSRLGNLRIKVDAIPDGRKHIFSSYL